MHPILVALIHLGDDCRAVLRDREHRWFAIVVLAYFAILPFTAFGFTLPWSIPVFGSSVKLTELALLLLSVIGVVAHARGRLPMLHAPWLYGFLALAHLALAAGYLGAVRRPARVSTVRWSPRRLLWASVVLNLLLLAPTLKYRTGGRVEIAAALIDPGSAYSRAASALTDRHEIRYVEYVRIVSGPLLGLLLPLSVVYWRRLGWWTRFSAVVAIGGDLSLWIATGRNKGIADLIFVLPWLRLIGQQRHSRAFPSKKVVRTIAFLLAGGLLFAATFTWFVSSRDTQNIILPYDDGAQIEARLPLKSPNLQFANSMIVGLTTYVSQGYYGLSLGLDEPFVPTWGLGNSMFLMSLAEKVTGNPDLHFNTYPARIEKYGWEALRRFHTFYLWVASDLSFPGTIVIVYLLGRLLATCWVNALGDTNPLAVALLANLLIIFYYIPANNQIMQFPEQMTALWVTLVVWWITTRRRRPSRGGQAAPDRTPGARIGRQAVAGP